MSPEELARAVRCINIAKIYDMTVTPSGGQIHLAKMPSGDIVRSFYDTIELYYYLIGYDYAKKS